MTFARHWVRLAVDILAIGAGSALLAGTMTLVSMAMGWRLTQVAGGHLDLVDGTRIAFDSDTEFEQLTARHRGNVAGMKTSNAWTLPMWVIVISPQIFAGLYIVFRSRDRLPKWFQFGWRLLALGIAGSVAIIGFSIVYGLIATRLGVRVPEALSSRGIDATSWLMLVLMVVVVVPILEELFFRGNLFEAIEATFGDRTALVATSMLFALVHILLIPDGLARAIPYVAAGLVLGWLRRHTQGLVAPTVAHMLNNATVAVLAYSSASS